MTHSKVLNIYFDLHFPEEWPVLRWSNQNIGDTEPYPLHIVVTLSPWICLLSHPGFPITRQCSLRSAWLRLVRPFGTMLCGLPEQISAVASTTSHRNNLHCILPPPNKHRDKPAN